MKKWLPDPEVLKRLEKEIAKQSDTSRIALGSRILTWQNVLEEVRIGTPFGRQYYSACLKSSRSKK